MIYAGVKHNNSNKVFWFKVPKSLYNEAAIRKKVICKTKYGMQPGEIVELVSCREKSEIKRITGVSPSQSVTGIEAVIKIDDIKITSAFSDSLPAPEKIESRETEYKLFGKFLTKVEFNKAGYLLDGYTAYLVAKKLGHKELNGFMVTGRRKKDFDE